MQCLSLIHILPVTQFNMTEIEELGLLKMAFLGLRTLTVIHDAETAVQKHHPEFSIQKLDYDDPDTYRTVSYTHLDVYKRQ